MLKRLDKQFRAFWLNFVRSESGVSAIEFTFVAPLIFLVMGITLETGFMVFAESNLQAAVEDAARTIRTGNAQLGGVSSATFKQNVCADIAYVANCSSITVYVRSEPDFATLKANLPSLLTIGPSTDPKVTQPSCFKPGAPSNPAIVIATYDWYFVTFGMSAAFGNVAGNKARRLVGMTLFQNQPYPGTGAGAC